MQSQERFGGSQVNDPLLREALERAASQLYEALAVRLDGPEADVVSNAACTAHDVALARGAITNRVITMLRNGIDFLGVSFVALSFETCSAGAPDTGGSAVHLDWKRLCYGG